MWTGLLKTKLYRPLVRPGFVLRPHLIKRLDEGLNSKVTVVSAPAGYGKTSLISAWAVERHCPVAWLSLDEDDNHPARFLYYLIAATQTIQPNLGQEFLSVLQSPQPPAILNLLPILINQLDDIPERFVLVLDDYHLITSPEIHKAITFLVDHQPPQMNLTIMTRIDPPLSLAHLRGRGQLTELRQADLRFSEEETTAFLKYGAGIELSPGEVNLLVNRTEGWIAGLQMAALSMTNKTDISAFMARFGGSHEYIVDYFASEILSNLPVPVKSFLLKTSFLNQLCGPLCDAVTDQNDGQQMLERLQKENLFVIPLDDEHIWYRYHQLFADFLQKNLRQIYPEELSELYLHASQWYEQNEFPHQAVEHAFLASDYPRMARLLEDVSDLALRRGESIWLLKWIEKLPVDQIIAHLRLSIIRVAILVASGLAQSAEEALQNIDDQLQLQPLDPATQDYVIGRITALRAMIAIQRGDIADAKRYAEIALTKLSIGIRRDAPWRADTLIALAFAHFAMGNPADGRLKLAMAIEDAKNADSPYTFLDVSTYAIEALWIQGQLREAIEICRKGLKYIDENNLQAAPMSGEVLLGYSYLLSERYDLEQAETYLNRGTELARSSGITLVLAWAYYVRMRYLVAKGDYLAAEAAAREADQLPQLSGLALWVKSGISALKVLIWVRLGMLAEAEEYLKLSGIWIESGIQYYYQREYLSLAALLIAKEDIPAAVALLDSIIEWAEAREQFRTLICAWTLRSLVYAARQEKQKAVQCLASAVDLAEPEGYMLTILELGEGIAPIIYEAAQKGVHPEYASRLLGVLKEARQAQVIRPDTHGKQIELITPLRAREIEVLQLVAEGLTNKEIASKLHISLRTVKFHMTTIFNKLGVNNRMSAVEKARLLGII